MTTNEEIIGRADVNDLEAILSITNTDVDEVDPRRQGQRRRHLHVGLREGRAPGAQQAVREGQDVAVERRDRPAVGHRGRPREGRRRRDQAAIAAGLDADHLRRHAVRASGASKEWLEFGIESQNWTLSPVHARRAGRAALHRQDRRDRAVDRRQVLRRHPGDGRGPPRRGLRQVPRHEARRATTRSTPTCGCCSTTSSTTAAGT